MPKQDTTVALEDENGEECIAFYIAQRTALSAGWKSFSANHKLVEGDVLIFHLVSSLKFKVYMVRVFELNKVDRSFGSLDVNIHAKPVRSIRMKQTKRPSKRVKRLDLLPDDNVENNSMIVLDTNSDPLVNQYDILAMVTMMEATITEKYEASPEHTRMKEEKNSLGLKLAKLKDAMRKLDTDIETLKANSEKQELMFQEEVTAPW
ncbi:putative AP2/B3-like transcriptional factor family protein [Hibiscus syriacus]|uniref:AP2/B3-like transcriptional factor family protein n=1 Tax=Hibiscus syriacus TaxID=106335 RepID=A0A6A3BYP5_HIBSY|nr:putative AP2/B3-like transcriptional factor family protein [Hibiscus syriacus]